MTISHTKGSLNAAADALSRYPLYGRPYALGEGSPTPPPPVCDTTDVLPSTAAYCES